jgi:uncharacterized protein (TIGR00369 family)
MAASDFGGPGAESNSRTSRNRTSATINVDRALRALDTPLLFFIGARPLDPARPQTGILIDVDSATENAVGALHGGVISTLLDLAAYMALASDLAPDEEAVTHALFVSYQREARSGDRVAARGKVARRTTRLAFIAAELRTDEQVLATGHVTKSIVRSRP